MFKKIVIFVLFFLGNYVIAGDVNKLGTVGATELLIPVGARSIAMGGAAVASISGTEAIYWNPAGAFRSNKSELLFNNMSYIADIDVNYLAAVFNGEDIGAFGVHIKSLSFGDITEQTVDMPDGTGRTFSPDYVIAGVTYSRPLTERIHAGITGKYIYENIMQTSASTIAFDIGIQYAFATGLRLGVVINNLGGKMQFNGRNLEQDQRVVGSLPTSDLGHFRGISSDADIPTTFSFGFSYDYMMAEDHALQMESAFTQFNDSPDYLRTGVEYGLNNMFFLRGGYSAAMQNSGDSIFGPSFGAGLKYNLGEFEIQIDYAYRQVTEYFDSSNIFTIKVGI